MVDGKIERVTEFKNPMPETHRRWLLDHFAAKTVPDDHYWQCQAAMAIAECDFCDFLSFCPGEAPLLVTLPRSAVTDQLAVGLEEMAIQKAKIEDELADMWDAEYGGPDGPILLTYHNGAPMFDEFGQSLDQDGNILVAMEGQAS